MTGAVVAASGSSVLVAGNDSTGATFGVGSAGSPYVYADTVNTAIKTTTLSSVRILDEGITATDIAMSMFWNGTFWEVRAVTGNLAMPGTSAGYLTFPVSLSIVAGDILAIYSSVGIMGLGTGGGYGQSSIGGPPVVGSQMALSTSSLAHICAAAYG